MRICDVMPPQVRDFTDTTHRFKLVTADFVSVKATITQEENHTTIVRMEGLDKHLARVRHLRTDVVHQTPALPWSRLIPIATTIELPDFQSEREATRGVDDVPNFEQLREPHSAPDHSEDFLHETSMTPSAFDTAVRQFKEAASFRIT
ncbi:hypothetical protein TorRG33x02_088670 [Trema orientale]|uniref:Uncharacterized protein n=1 Tax=Trema orientale TaxID=63057 RepID=A0A2P5FC46_TREOI|nr:hypothetical protein TorRG33x02_088670 [Trema orientale]